MWNSDKQITDKSTNKQIYYFLKSTVKSCFWKYIDLKSDQEKTETAHSTNIDEA